MNYNENYYKEKAKLLLWFAWKIVLLQYRKQRAYWNRLCWGCCDLLEKSYFCSIANNTPYAIRCRRSVVICLKNRTFAVSQTTITFWICPKPSLWFAWKIVLLQYRKQHIATIIRPKTGCDLLEKSYFCSIANNVCGIGISINEVVICLKNRTFAVSQTTSHSLLLVVFQLWFAWKIVLLQYRKQLFRRLKIYPISCDLLEKSYFCSIANNHTYTPQHPCQLWFAWKIVLLQYRKQPVVVREFSVSGCDLLEKSYFCSIANNRTNKATKQKMVVICLKNRTFAVSQTTFIQALPPF